MVAFELILANHVETALAVLTMFFAYLRPGEGIALVEEDLVPPSVSTVHFALNLHPAQRGVASKTGFCDETIVSDQTDFPQLGEALTLLNTGDPIQPLFAMPAHQIRQEFYEAQEHLEMFPPRATLQRLRHGGLSHDARAKLRIPKQVKERGRWA